MKPKQIPVSENAAALNNPGKKTLRKMLPILKGYKY